MKLTGSASIGGTFKTDHNSLDENASQGACQSSCRFFRQHPPKTNVAMRILMSTIGGEQLATLHFADDRSARDECINKRHSTGVMFV